MSLVPSDANLKSVGRDRWRGRCPIGEHGSGAFSVTRHRDGHLIFQCFSCHERGSVIDLYSKLNNCSISEAIKALSVGLEPINPDVIIQRSYDSFQRSKPAFGVVMCDCPGCFRMISVASELEFAILRSGTHWNWKVSKSGKFADCGFHVFVSEHMAMQIKKILSPYVETLPIMIELNNEIAKGD